MASELWEIVKITELKPGDEIRSPDGERYFWTDAYASALEGCTNYYPDKVRRYTGPSPEVLMRALENACSEIDARDKYGVSPNPKPDDFIAEAEAEIAKEAKDNAR